jgi:hypothetical protein
MGDVSSKVVFVVEPLSELDDLDFEDRVIAQLDRRSHLMYIDHINVEFFVDGDPDDLDEEDLETRIARAFPHASSVRVAQIKRTEGLATRLRGWVSDRLGSKG